MAKILLVDDDTALRSVVKEILTSDGHSVLEAENGRVARDLIPLAELDLIISDFQMPFVDGLELLKWVKSTNDKLPFILITGFSHILETQEAFQHGADDFLTKPLKKEDILGTVQRIVGSPPQEAQSEAASKEADNTDLDSQYCRIPVQDFVSSEQVHVNIYVRLSARKYVRVAHRGDHVPVERVENYKVKGIEYLYAMKDDFAQLVGFNLKVAKLVQTRGDLSASKKLSFLRYTTETVLENLAVNGIDANSFRSAKECVALCLTLMSESPSIFDLLDTLNAHADWIYAHSLGVSTYGVMIARQMGWSSSATLFKIGTSGLLHDIGLKEIEQLILEKSRVSLSQAERKQYETHPTRGLEIVRDLRELPNDVMQVIYHHHESCTGQGYPSALAKERIHPLAKVLAVADHFCYHALKTPTSPGCPAPEALQKMMQFDSDQFDSVALRALGSLIVAH